MKRSRFEKEIFRSTDEGILYTLLNWNIHYYFHQSSSRSFNVIQWKSIHLTEHN